MEGYANSTRSEYGNEASARVDREAPISRELDMLAKNIAKLEMVAVSLLTRLQPIVVPFPSNTKESVGASKAPSLSTVGDAIAASNRRIIEIGLRLAGVRDNLGI